MTMADDAKIVAVSVIAVLGIELAAYALQTKFPFGMHFAVFIWFANNGLWEDWCDWTPRLVAMTTVFLCSRGWLLVFLAWRAHSRKGDSRFEEQFGWNYLYYWMVQFMWLATVSWPLLIVKILEPRTTISELSTRDIVWLTGFAGGVVFEIVADVQKAMWVHAGREGTFCAVGLWRFSRHPNYFGEIFQWWCAWGLSYGSWAGVPDVTTRLTVMWFLGCLSPLFTMHILLNLPATGIWDAEGNSLWRYYDSEDGEAYEEYRASTSPLIPMVGYQHIPLSIQRTFLFEWDRFEDERYEKEE